MVGTAIAPSLTGIVKHTNFSISPSWLITLPSLGVVVFAPIIGGMLKRFGNYKVLIFGLLPYGVLGVVGAFISNDYLLVLDRFLLGGATVAVQVSVTSTIAELFTGEKRMKMLAWQVMSIEFGGVLFLSIGGVLGEMHWQYPFYIYLIALVCLFLVLKTVPQTGVIIEEEKAKLQTVKERKLKVIVVFCACLLAMMLFFVGFVTLPLYLPGSFGFTESQIGYFMASISFVTIITASQMTRMVKIFGETKTVTFGFLFYMLGYLVLSTTASIPFLFLTALFIGIGFGCTIPLLRYMMVDASTPQNQGKNLSFLSMGVFGGQFLSTFIQYVSKDYKAVYATASVLALIVGVLMYSMFKKIAKNIRLSPSIS